jgi:Protein of unknown function (DUF4238)
MQPKRRNHYLSRLYLKRWANADSDVYVYRLLVSHEKVPLWKPSSVSGIGYHHHLYTRVLAGEETDEFENWLERAVETPAAGPLRKATTGERLTSDDWACIIRFLAAQDVRTPARLVEFLGRQTQQLPALTQDVLEDAVRRLKKAKQAGQRIDGPPSDSAVGLPIRVTTEIEPGAEVGVLKVETLVGRSFWLWSLPRLLTRTYKVLLGHAWTILRPPRGVNWVTSDNPVVKLNGRYDFKGGWGSKGTEIFMPIGPEHLLYTQIGDRPAWRKGERLPEPVAHAFKKFIIENAHRYIYAKDADPSVSKLRPRTVNAAAFESEADQWKRWETEQSEAEREMNNPASVRQQRSGTQP